MTDTCPYCGDFVDDESADVLDVSVRVVTLVAIATAIVCM